MEIINAVNDFVWADWALYIVFGTGVLFTLWSGFCQYRALTHGVQVTRGVYDNPDDPGAINHFQALSAALSATVGLGNIGGVAVAIALGGPRAVFWMWMIGLAGMALKTTEVTLSMLYRNTDDPNNPHGGPMWVADKGLTAMGLPWIGKPLAAIFCVTLVIAAVTGGNMFQAWNVGIVTRDAFGIPTIVTGILLSVMVGMVIIGGIKRIGAVAGRLVPFMCVMYLLAACYVVISNISELPDAFALIFRSAFAPAEAQNAFLGGTMGYAFLWGMKRALFSSEAGQGSSPIAHSAAKTDEPVREAVVAGLEPFIDTIVVCTLTALVIIMTNAWNRPGEAHFATSDLPVFKEVQKKRGDDAAQTRKWTLGKTPLPDRTKEAKRIAQGRNWSGGEKVFVIAEVTESDSDTGSRRRRLLGDVSDDAPFTVEWETIESTEKPTIVGTDLYRLYPAAALTTYAFDKVTPGLGTWMVMLASWLFALSTMISWSYYGEQGMIYMLGEWSVLPFKLTYCLLILVACWGFMETASDLSSLTDIGTGVMLWANIPIMLIFGFVAMRSYHDYIRRLKAGEFKRHAAPSITDVIEGRDVDE